MSVVLATGCQVHSLEVVPTDEFHRRIDAATPFPRSEPAEAVSYP